AVCQAYPPASTFSTDEILDLSGKVMIVPDRCAMSCRRLEQAFLKHNAMAFEASRNKKKADMAINDLRRQTGKQVTCLELDL
ncbi:uncharacterized protein LAESUDRAFT_623454, partial [Laetiporus sulphureus 93-53]